MCYDCSSLEEEVVDLSCQVEELEASLDLAENKITEYDNELYDAQMKIDELTEQVEDLESSVAEIECDLSFANEEIYELENKVDYLEIQLDEAKFILGSDEVFQIRVKMEEGFYTMEQLIEMFKEFEVKLARLERGYL
jgi:chromosome segregation ATPase